MVVLFRLISDLVLFTLVALPFAATFASGRRWLHRRRHRRARVWLVLTIVLAVMTMASTQWVAGVVLRNIERFSMAAELGVDLDHYAWAARFPATYFASQARRGETTRPEVHALMGRARSRYICQKGRSEKYLFLSTNYRDAEIANVLYDDHDIVYLAVPVDSGDEVPIEECSPF